MVRKHLSQVNSLNQLKELFQINIEVVHQIESYHK
jgi:hypothetical protein